VQGLQEYFWKEYEVNAKLNDIVVRAFEETWQTRERFDTSMRMAPTSRRQRVSEATTTWPLIRRGTMVPLRDPSFRFGAVDVSGWASRPAWPASAATVCALEI